MQIFFYMFKIKKWKEGIMATFLAGALKKSTTFELNGKVYRVIEFQHVKPGKGAAFIRTKLRDVKTSQVLEKTFSPTDKLEDAIVEMVDMQYIYSDGNLHYFMDTNTYEQIAIDENKLEEALKYIKENMTVKILSHNGEVFAVEPPVFVELEVTYTEPGFNGNTATTSGKPATLENGLNVSVPLFVEIGDILKIDTRTGEYMERVNK